MANLADHIRVEIGRGILNDIFTIQDLTSLGRQGESCEIAGVKYPIKSVREILANQSIGPGDRKGQSVKIGLPILFVKHDVKATYSIFDDDDYEEETFSQSKSINENFDDQTDCDDIKRSYIASKFVDYLREKPFRNLYVRNNQLNWSPVNGPISGWSNRLNEYEWKGANWTSTVLTVNSFISRLDSIRENISDWGIQTLEAEAELVYRDIKNWGNPKAPERSGSFVLSQLKNLWEGEITNVDSTLTKLYAFADPNNVVIYDSRVAAAIISIAEDIFRYRTINRERKETVNIYFHPCFPNLGSFPGAGGTRPRAHRWSGWPDAYRKVAAQMDANLLCKGIVNCLNDCSEDGRSNWNLREVEAVLFMEGY